jgi:hypothetical protein
MAHDMSHSAQYFQSKWTILLVPQESGNPPNQAAYPLEAGFEDTVRPRFRRVSMACPRGRNRGDLRKKRRRCTVKI